MINKRFLGILKKYESCRIEDDIYVKVLIKHKDEGSVQTFLDPFIKRLGIDNIKNLFDYPVRWKRMVIDTSDYVLSSYKITFGEIDFNAVLHEILITRKLVEGNDIFDYSLVFMKPPSSDELLDPVIIEAYLNYKEENDAGKRVLKEFDINLELLNKEDSLTEQSLSVL